MWTDEMTKIIREQFVAVAVSGHVAMNRKDAEGEFLRATGIKLAGAGGNMECLRPAAFGSGRSTPPVGPNTTAATCKRS